MATRNTARLWLPISARPSAETERFVCRLCQSKFARPDHLARHVAHHVRHEEGDVRMLSPAERAPGLMGDDGVDVEWQQWHQQRGA